MIDMNNVAAYSPLIAGASLGAAVGALTYFKVRHTYEYVSCCLGDSVIKVIPIQTDPSSKESSLAAVKEICMTKRDDYIVMALATVISFLVVKTFLIFAALPALIGAAALFTAVATPLLLGIKFIARERCNSLDFASVLLSQEEENSLDLTDYNFEELDIHGISRVFTEGPLSPNQPERASGRCCESFPQLQVFDRSPSLFRKFLHCFYSVQRT